jgi:subtilase family serine protease
VKAALIRGLLAGLVTLAVLFGQDSFESVSRHGHPTVASARPGEARPHSWIRENAGRGSRAASARNPSGFWPTDIWNAYSISPNGGAHATIAIVDAYDSPNALADLNAFSAQFGLPGFPPSSSSATCSPSFTKVNEHGQSSSLPRRNSGWEVEINLDTQWAHAVAPCANVVLVEANSSSLSDLLTAVQYAKSVASVVSMSWGGSEFRSETYYDSIFVQTGVTFVASSGDTGGIVSWPASSQNVIGVGGTQLAAGTGGGLASPTAETAWSGSGGGCSTIEPSLSFQKAFLPKSPGCSRRGVPDVAIAGGDQSAVAVYVSDQGGWYEVYGTSLSAQLWAGLIADANGPRGSSLAATLSDLYADAAGAPSSTPYLLDFRDITSGATRRFSAAAGWDFITGLGSPLMNSLAANLFTQQ